MTEQMKQLVCERLASGDSLTAMCKEEGMPSLRTVWLETYRNEAFYQQYARARISWAEVEFERMMHIADHQELGIKIKHRTGEQSYTEETEADMTEHRKLQIDTRKWALARMNKKFTDRAVIETRTPEDDMTPEEVAKRMSAILDAGAKRKEQTKTPVKRFDADDIA